MKAHRYWPTATEGPWELTGHGLPAVRVTALGANAQVEGHPDIQTTTISVACSGEDPRTVRVVQYTGWPDFGVPDRPEAIQRLLDIIHEAVPLSGSIPSGGPPHVAEGPIFVHCSAGVGRTGTLLSAYVLHHLFRKGQKPTTAPSPRLADDSVFRVVSTLKWQRRGMVQRKEQYAFIYACARALLSAPLDLPSSEPSL